MYIFVNTTLKMDKGKTAAQVGHFCQKATEYMLTAENSAYAAWKMHGSKKIVLRATAEQIYQLARMKNSIIIIDAGLTQIAPGSMTVVGFCPGAVDSSMFAEYKLL